MLAIPFRSYIQPLIVMISIPFGIVPSLYIAIEDVRRIASRTWTFLFAPQPIARYDEEAT